jgi:ubiquitin-protein ligase
MLLVLQDPNLESPANIDAAKSLRDNKKEYIKIVRKKLISK